MGSQGVSYNEYIPCSDDALERTLMEMEGGDGQALRSKLLSDLPIPPRDSWHKFLRKRKKSIKHEPCKFAREGKNRNKEFHQRMGLGLAPYPAHAGDFV